MACAGAGGAAAEAWGPPSDGVFISTFAVRRAPAGPLIEQDIHADFHVRRDWSVVVRPRYEAGGGETRSEMALGAKWARQFGETAFSASAGPVWASDGFGGCAGWSGEGRIAVGRGIALTREMDGFFEAAAGFRSGASYCSQSKIDLTLGARASPHYLWLGQGFFFTDRHAVDTFKVQASGVRVLRDGAGVQLGVRAAVSGGRFEEPTLVIGYWRSATAR